MRYALLDPAQNYNNVGSSEVSEETLAALGQAAEDFGKDAAGCSLEFRNDIGYIVLHRDGVHVLVFARLE